MATKQVRVANFHRATVEAGTDLIQATSVTGWQHSITCVGALVWDKPRTLDGIFSHLQVRQRELLHECQGPERLRQCWDIKTVVHSV